MIDTAHGSSLSRICNNNSEFNLRLLVARIEAFLVLDKRFRKLIFCTLGKIIGALLGCATFKVY